MKVKYQIYVTTKDRRRIASKEVALKSVPRAGDYVEYADDWPPQEVSHVTFLLNRGVLV